MSFRIATVGYVDHGKSTLIGRLLADSGQTRDDRRAKVESYCQTKGQRFEYAFLLDALEEEQTQGITLDVTEVPWSWKGQDFIFVDTPGHREFLKKMVGGASRVDAALLMLDVTEGVRDTFRRQIKVLDLLGVRSLVVLINKMDLVHWSESFWREREYEVRDLLSQHQGTLRILPIAAWHGANLLRRATEMSWYDGPTLGDTLLQLRQENIKMPESFRFSVQDVYRLKDQRVMVGRVESGEVRVGDPIAFYPGGQQSRVRSIEVHEETRTTAGAFESIGLTLEDSLYLDRGSLAFPPQQPPFHTRRAVADVFWLASNPLLDGARVLVKSTTRGCPARVVKVLKEFDADSFHERAGDRGLKLFGRVLIEFDTEFAFDPFTTHSSTGRFVLSRQGEVLGGGRWVEAAEFTTNSSKGEVLWFTGLSGAGKTTLARSLERAWRDSGRPTVVLDGDELRQGLCRDLRFSPEDRHENIRRAAEVAKLFANQGFLVITAFISPLRDLRELAREIIGGDRFNEIYIDAPLAICESRDVKGLYARARSGTLSGFTGVSAPFEPPSEPDLHLRTDLESPQQSLNHLLQYLSELNNEERTLS